MNVEFLLCAESGSVDQQRNSLSIFHIYEEFNSAVFPFVVPYLFIIALCTKTADERDPENVSVRVTLGDEELLRGPIAMAFQGKTRLRVMTQIGGLILPRPGTLRVTMVVGETVKGLWNISVLNIGHPVTQTPLPLA